MIASRDERSVALTTREPVKVMVHKSGQDKLLARINYTGPVRTPIDNGQRIGAIKIWRGPNLAVEQPVFATESVGTGSMARRAFDTATELVIGWVRAGAGKL